MERTLKVSKWGNGQAIRLPKAILNMLSINEGDELEISTDNGKIVLNPIKEDNFTFADLFKNYDGETKQNEYWEDLEPVGKEVFD